MLVHSDNVHALEEDMGTSTAQRAYHRQSRLELERRGQKILQKSLLRAKREADQKLGPPRLCFTVNFELSTVYSSEVEAQLRRQGARCDEVRATERREKVIKRHLIRHVDGRQA
jgi:hypothetical protein